MTEPQITRCPTFTLTPTLASSLHLHVCALLNYQAGVKGMVSHEHY
jgi:hypothetical protein